MAEEIRFKLIVDTADGAEVVKALQSQLETLRTKLTEVKSVSNPVIPSTAFDALKDSAPANSIDALKAKLAELNESLGQTEISTQEFNQLSAAIQDTTAQLKSASDTVKGINVEPVTGSLGEMKQRVRELTTEIQNVDRGSQEFKNLQSEIFKANSEIRNIDRDLKGFTDRQGLRATVKSVEGLVAGFELASHATELFGGSEATAEKATIAAAQAVKAMTIIMEVRRVGELAIEGRMAANFALQKLYTIGTYAQTAAQAALNAVMEANPLGLLILGVTAVIGIFAAFKDKIAIVGEAFKFAMIPLNLLMDGLKALGKLIGITGDGETKAIRERLQQQFELKQKAYEDEIKIAKAAGEETYNIEKKKLSDSKSFAEERIKYLSSIEGKLTETQEKELATQKENLQKANSEIIVLDLDRQKELQKQHEKTVSSQIATMNEGLAKETAIINESVKKQVDAIVGIEEIRKKVQETGLASLTSFERDKYDEMQSIQKKGAEDTAKKVYDTQKKSLDTLNQISILSTAENSKARLDAEVVALEKTKEFEIKYGRLTADERKLLEVKTEDEIVKKKEELRKKELEDDQKVLKQKLEAIKATAEADQNAIDKANLIRQQGIEEEKFVLEKELYMHKEASEERLAILKLYGELEREYISENAEAEAEKFEAENDKRKAEAQANYAANKIDYATFLQEIQNSDQKAQNDKQKLALKTDAAIFASTKKTDEEILQNKKGEFEREKQLLQSVHDFSQGLEDVALAFAGDNTEKQKKIKKEFALFQMGIALAQIYSNTAQAVTLASATIPPPFDVIAIAADIAQGAIQGALAIAQYNKVMSMATGGLVHGPGTETSDSIPARLSKGESVINAKSTKMFTPLLSAINEAGGGVSFGFASGGIATGIGSNENLSDDFENKIVSAVHTAVSTAPAFKAFVVESDITQKQKKIGTIRSRAALK